MTIEFLLNIAVVTIRTRGGREVDLTDHAAEYRRRREAGRIVMNTSEVRALQTAGDKKIGEIALDVKEIFQGEVWETVPSSGPYPWDRMEQKKQERKEDGRKQWW